MRAILKEPNRQQTPGFLRFKMNQHYRIIVFIVTITLLSEAACQSSTFNITEYNRHKKGKWIFRMLYFLPIVIMGDTAG